MITIYKNEIEWSQIFERRLQYVSKIPYFHHAPAKSKPLKVASCHGSEGFILLYGHDAAKMIYFQSRSLVGGGKSQGRAQFQAFPWPEFPDELKQEQRPKRRHGAQLASSSDSAGFTALMIRLAC